LTNRAEKFIKTGDSQYIRPVAAGNFNRDGEDAAYYAYDPRYAAECARGAGKSILKQTVPVSFLRGPNAIVYEAEPSDEWRRVCHLPSNDLKVTISDNLFSEIEGTL
jgi:hypothetical protein